MKKNDEDERRFVFEPEVKLRSRGAGRTPQRKVVCRGVKSFWDGGAMLPKIEELLRQGYEVRLHGGDEENPWLRIFPCLKADLATVRATAQTMGDWPVRCYDGKRVRLTHRGENVNVRDVVEKVAEGREKLDEVVPDSIVTCPQCEHKFRVGRKLGN